MTLADAPRVPERYELLRLLGRGGMGSVWLARDRRLDRHVAIKVLDCRRPRDLERFRHEAFAAGRLRSRSIVKIHELDECDGHPCLVMEYVDGGSLADRDLDLVPLVAAMREVAAALAHAHEQGIVHRDLKPANILLDRDGRAYVTDFGLARSLLAVDADAGSADAIVGTPQFMSPEQARGEPGDARSDVFSFGVTFYCKLERRPPFAGDTLVDVLRAIVHAEPAALDEARVPRALEQLVRRCLAKAPSDRYQSMREVLRDLGRVATGLADPGATAGWLRRFARNLARREPSADPHQSALAPAVLDRDTIDHHLYGVGSHVHVLDALAGLDAHKAGARVPGAPHTIFQIADHMLYWERIAHVRIHGQPHEPPARAAEGWIERPAPVDDREWGRTLEGLAGMLRTLEQSLPVWLDPAAYEVSFVERVRKNLHMVVTHNSYHVGQIVVLRQLLGCWPPPRGGDTW